MKQLPLEFPRIYRGQHAVIDDVSLELCAPYSWGVRNKVCPDGTLRPHIVGRKAGEREERTLASVVTDTRGYQFTSINGDPLDFTLENLCMTNPEKYLRQNPGKPWPGATRDDDAHQIELANKRINDSMDHPRRRKRLGFGERPEW